MLEFIKKFSYEKYGRTMKSYRIILISSFIQVAICLSLIAFFSDLWLFVIVGSVIMNILSNYSYHFHCKNLDYCTIITCILFYIFGYISKQSPLWVAFLLCIFMIKHMYVNMPLKIINKKRSEEWHKKRFILFVMMFVVASIVLHYYGYYHICSTILWSINMYGSLYFINENEYI